MPWQHTSIDEFGDTDQDYAAHCCEKANVQRLQQQLREASAARDGLELECTDLRQQIAQQDDQYSSLLDEMIELEYAVKALARLIGQR